MKKKKVVKQVPVIRVQVRRDMQNWNPGDLLFGQISSMPQAFMCHGCLGKSKIPKECDLSGTDAAPTLSGKLDCKKCGKLYTVKGGILKVETRS